MSLLRLVRFLDGDADRHPRWGVVVGELVHVVDDDFPTTRSLLEHGLEAVSRARNSTDGMSRPLSKILGGDSLLSPITHHQQIICQAVNYRAHALESGLGRNGLGANVFFRKASSSLTSARADVIRPAGVTLLDHEIELGIVIGKRIDRPVSVTWENLHEFVAGVVAMNDVSARDIQVPEGQFFKGKSFRTFCPSGPFLCLLDRESTKRIPDLELRLTVDGDERQRGRASDMIYAPPATLTELSRVMDLDAGDVISTGTPVGVALRAPRGLAQKVSLMLPSDLRWSLFKKMQARSPLYLSPGQTMEATIRTDDGAIDLGAMRNRVVSA